MFPVYTSSGKTEPQIEKKVGSLFHSSMPFYTKAVGFRYEGKDLSKVVELMSGKAPFRAQVCQLSSTPFS